MSHLHYYYYCPETNTYELDESPIPVKSPPRNYNPPPTSPYPFSSNPSSPSSDRDSFFGSSSDLSYSSSAYNQNAIISAIPKPSESVQDFSIAAGRSRFSAGLDVESKSSPHYVRRQPSEIYSPPRPRHARSVNTLTKVQPVRPVREKRSSSWRPFLLPTSSRVVAHGSQTNLTHAQALTSQVSSCPPHGRHLNGACTCPPDVGHHANPHGRPTPRSSYSVLQIDTSNKLNDARSLGSRIAPPINTAGPAISSLPFPSISPTSPYLPPSLSKGPNDSRRYSDNSDGCYISCYKRTPSSTRLSPARVPGTGPNKLTKPRPPKSPQGLSPTATSPISPPSAPPHLSPRPLSSVEIASAKLTPVSVPPLTLPEYLTTSKRRHLTLRELADKEEMADMLHAARPASLPLQQHSPPQKWKPRRINFLSSISTPSMAYSDSSHNRTNSKTGALASLAWTGVVPLSPASPAESGHSDESLPSSEHESQGRSTALRKGKEFDRDWTFAMAMADEEVTDEVLVEQLEKMRDGTSHGDDGKDQQFHPSLVWMQHPPRPGSSARKRSISSPDANDASLHPHALDRAHTSDALDLEDAMTWRTARRALLCCREMVRTEKRYQEELKALINGETTTPPPPLMLTYLPALLRASEVLLKRLSEDPSAWGVSTAFMGCEEELDAAMVAWSGVAGQFFSKKRKSRSWRRPRSRSSSQTHVSVPSSPTSTHIPPVPPVPNMKPGSASGDGATSASPPKLVLMVDQEKEKKSETDERFEKTSEKADVDDEKKARKAERKLSVRDLAIQPTQRVMRYVMLYRDLLAHTPQSSPSRALVEGALEAAQRIAQKCDHAQDNTAFLPASPTTSPSVPSPSDSNKHPLRSFMTAVPTRQEN